MFNYDALRSAPIRNHPTPHIVVENFLSPEVFHKLSPLFPEISQGGSFPAASFRHAPLFQQMLLEFEGEKLQKEVAQKFNLSLENPPTLLTLRGQTRPSDGKMHCDSKSKAVTILLYFNPLDKEWPENAGCLQFCDSADPKHLVSETANERAVPPKGGTLIIFPNSDHSWHGHLPYEGQRRTIQLNYMHHSWKAWLETKRHTLSALWKKWHHA
ncbi:2OG-Fe(II) oxygenase [Acetobacteraceae bacterium]|nr:2OG-Fe(II) oxygenase [Acetobacteraceae bacterium]